jgi:peptidoglycan/LPS O-acetylase OafA/YrhL
MSGAGSEPKAHRNNFAALRVFAALLVIYGHGRDLKGFVPPILWNFPIFRTGLDIFFSLSGYLVMQSWLADPRPGAFLAKRALRIFPALIACVLATIFLVGPLSTHWKLKAYFASHTTWQYLLNIALYLKLNLPGVFPGMKGGAVNGSLWSLFPEFLCYLALPCVWLLPRLARGALLLTLMAVSGSVGLYLFAYDPQGHTSFYHADLKYVLVEVPFFMAGAFIRLVHQRFPGALRTDLALACCVSCFLLPPALDTMSIPFEWLTFAYLVITFGTQSTPVLRRVDRFGDFSYGLYLYAFPIQQMVLERVHSFAISICTCVTFGAAMVSWHLVEKPALRFKPQESSPFLKKRTKKLLSV